MTLTLSKTSILLTSALFVCAACSSSDSDTAPIQTGNDAPAEPSPEDDSIAGKAASTINDFTSFLDEQEISAGAIAISYEGTLVDSAGVNRLATDNAPVASLSKAITAVCTMKALELGNVLTSAALPDVIDAYLSQYDIRDERLLDVTIKQLLTHSSGIHNDYSPPQLFEAPSPAPSPTPSGEALWLLKAIARDGVVEAPGTGFFYANANYFVLELIIESLTQEPYESYCYREVLAPLGIETARLSPDWAMLGAAGGWEISASDYLTFVNAYYKPNDMAGIDPATSELYAMVGNDIRYGLGALFRLTPQGAVYWHSGGFSWENAVRAGQFGSYFGVYPSGFSVSVNQSENLADDAFRKLDRLLYQLAE